VLPRVIGALLTAVLVVSGLAFLTGVLRMTEGMGFEYTLLGFAGAGLIYAVALRGPLGRAIGRMLEGEGESDADGVLGLRVADLEDRLQEISLETQRFAEIEDRLEFAERLLAGQRDQNREGNS
jgi:hypothetical protein